MSGIETLSALDIAKILMGFNLEFQLVVTTKTGPLEKLVWDT